LSFVLIIPTMFMQTYKWNVILRAQGIKVNFLYLVKLYTVGLFYSLLTPGKVGSFFRIPYLKKKSGKSLAKCSISLIVERIIDLTILLLIAALGAIFIFRQNIYILSFFLFAVVALFILIFVIFYLFKKQSFLDLFIKVFLPKRLRQKIRLGIDKFMCNMPDLKNLIFPVIAGFASWMTLLTQSYVVGRSLGLNLPYLKYIATATMGAVIGWIPISVGGLGTRDASLVYLLGSLNVNAETAVSISVLTSVIIYIIPALVGGILVLKKSVES